MLYQHHHRLCFVAVLLLKYFTKKVWMPIEEIMLKLITILTRINELIQY